MVNTELLMYAVGGLLVIGLLYFLFAGGGGVSTVDPSENNTSNVSSTLPTGTLSETVKVQRNKLSNRDYRLEMENTITVNGEKQSSTVNMQVSGTEDRYYESRRLTSSERLLRQEFYVTEGRTVERRTFGDNSSEILRFDSGGFQDPRTYGYLNTLINEMSTDGPIKPTEAEFTLSSLFQQNNDLLTNANVEKTGESTYKIGVQEGNESINVELNMVLEYNEEAGYYDSQRIEIEIDDPREDTEISGEFTQSIEPIEEVEQPSWFDERFLE